MQRPLKSLAFALFLLLLPGPVFAQPTPLQVGIYLNQPFVTQTNGHYSGFAIELWETIAAKTGLTYQYKPFATLPALLDAVTNRSIDVVVLNLTITADRLQRMDFTLPFMSTGLRLMINENRRGGFWQVVDNLHTSGHLKIYVFLVVGIVLGTIGLTLFDRRFDKDFPREWHKGAADSFYHVMSLVTSGTSSHKSLFGSAGRVMAAIWLGCGVALIAYITSSITSVMTTTSITSQINSTADLNRKRIGAVAGTVAAEFVRDAGLTLESFANLQDAVAALVQAKIDAVVDDAPTLESYDNDHPELPITEVGAVFRPQEYGFALPAGSPLGHTLSLQILSLAENGYIEKLKSKYFGNTP